MTVQSHRCNMQNGTGGWGSDIAFHVVDLPSHVHGPLTPAITCGRLARMSDWARPRRVVPLQSDITRRHKHAYIPFTCA